MKANTISVIAAAVCMAGAGVLTTAWGLPGESAADSQRVTSAMMRMGMPTAPLLPAPGDSKQLLSSSMHHSEWDRVPYGTGTLFAYVVYPDRSNRAPILVVNDRVQPGSDWARALADQAAAAGFIGVVADIMNGQSRLEPAEMEHRLQAVRSYVLSFPAANGLSGRVDLDRTAARLDVSVKGVGGARSRAAFALDESHWRGALSFVSAQTRDRPAFDGAPDASRHDMTGMAGPQAAVPGAATTSYMTKRPNLPADYYTAASTLAHSTLRKEWITLDVGAVPVHAWVEYPEGEGKAGTVIVMQHGTGLDTWVRGVADQLAKEGFIAVATDIWSGTAPDGGGFESFKFIDDALTAGRKISPDEAMRRYKAARDWALKLPRSNGRSASLGFCMGGGYSFRFAGEVPELNGAVVFYGTPPDAATMARIQSPVLGLYGENDVRVVAAVAPTIAAMKQLGKTYEPHVYPKATHSFVLFQEAAGNPAAVNDGWPRAMAFLHKQIDGSR